MEKPLECILAWSLDWSEQTSLCMPFTFSSHEFWGIFLVSFKGFQHVSISLPASTNTPIAIKRVKRRGMSFISRASMCFHILVSLFYSRFDLLPAHLCTIKQSSQASRHSTMFFSTRDLWARTPPSASFSAHPEEWRCSSSGWYTPPNTWNAHKQTLHAGSLQNHLSF